MLPGTFALLAVLRPTYAHASFRSFYPFLPSTSLTWEDVPGPPRFTVLSSDEKLGVGLGTRLVTSLINHNHNMVWKRFIDDTLINLIGKNSRVPRVQGGISTIHHSIKLTHEHSEQEIHLDATLFKGDRFQAEHILDIHTYIKSTNKQLISDHQIHCIPRKYIDKMTGRVSTYNLYLPVWSILYWIGGSNTHTITGWFESKRSRRYFSRALLSELPHH